MKPSADCETVRPLLFALLESGVSRAEREMVNLHLLVCPACRSEYVAEQSLTDLLGRPRPRRLRLLVPAAAAALVLACLPFLLGPGEAYGAASARGFAPDLTPVERPAAALGRANHFEVPTGESLSLDVFALGRLAAVGPARFELNETDTGWRLVMLQGTVRAETSNRFYAATALGLSPVGPGVNVLCAQGAAQEPTVAELMQQGNEAFFQHEDFEKAEELYAAALSHPKATPAEKTRAQFYLAAALGRQAKYEEAIEVQRDWLEKYPEDKSRWHVRFFLGSYLFRLGKEKEAERVWAPILREVPDSDYADLVRHYLKHPPREKPAEPVAEVLEVVVPPVTKERGGYLVVPTAIGEHAGFRKVAEKVAAHHQAAIFPFDGTDFATLRAELTKRRPENVLFVVPPEALDLPLHRRILMMSSKLDADAFPDFSFGYLTAKDAADLARLWDRTVKLEEEGLSSKTWVGVSVTSGGQCLDYATVPDAARRAGFTGSHLYFAFPGKDPKAWDFIDGNLPRLQTAGVITVTGCGDPEGIWIFSDKRNADRSKHWAYDPEKVGQDPEGEMPRVKAERIRKLRLSRPVVWSGTCHSGAVCRVFVEGDIVSTFGRTDRATVYEMPPEKSLCLAFLEAGAAAFLCPLGANHGYSVSTEVEYALREGATLGETIKSTYDDVLLACRGDLRLDIPVEGEPHKRGEPVMQGGGSNRILIGDPALRPFPRAAPSPSETVEVAKREDGFDVTVTWKAGHHWRAWDMFGTDRTRDHRIVTRLPLDDLLPSDRATKVEVRVKATGEGGKPLPYVIRRAEPEVYHGKRWLHLQANCERKLVDRKPVRAVFTVTIEKE